MNDYEPSDKVTTGEPHTDSDLLEPSPSAGWRTVYAITVDGDREVDQ